MNFYSILRNNHHHHLNFVFFYNHLKVYLKAMIDFDLNIFSQVNYFYYVQNFVSSIIFKSYNEVFLLYNIYFFNYKNFY